MSSPLWTLLRDRFQAWTGNVLSPTGAAQHLQALVDLSRAGGMSPEACLWTLDRGRSADRLDLIERLLIRTTWFMREAAPMQRLVAALAQRAAAQGSPRVRIWSVACSTGEEPYTLAMALIEAGLEPAILATDLSRRALGAAMTGEYEKPRVQSLPPGWRERHVETMRSGLARVRARVRACVTFEETNLSFGARPPQGWRDLDAVVCRNVLIYFARQDAVSVVRRLGDSCALGGFLLLGASELPLAWATDTLAFAAPNEVSLLRRVVAEAVRDAPSQPSGSILAHPSTPAPQTARSRDPEERPRPTPLAPAIDPASDIAAALEMVGRAPEAAVAVLERLLERHPLLPAGHLALGLVLKRAGLVGEAVKSLRSARLLFRDRSWMAPYELAVCLEKQCDWRHALEAYRHTRTALRTGAHAGLPAADGASEALAATILETCDQRISALERLG